MATSLRPGQALADAAGRVPEQTRRVARSGGLKALGRAGLAARGVIYLIIAVLAAEIALGSSGQSADQRGALETIAAKPFGWVLLVALAIGFAGYALWRWSAAVVGSPDGGAESTIKQVGRRLAALATGAVYAALCVSTVVVLAGGQAASSAQKQKSVTASLLALPFGRALVLAIAVGVVIAGCGLVWWAVTKRFEKKWAMETMAPATRVWAARIGVAGNVAMGVVLGLIGIFLAGAATSDNAGQSKGLDQTLRTLAAEPYGGAVLLAVALGVAAYSLYSFLEARYRRI